MAVETRIKNAVNNQTYLWKL